MRISIGSDQAGSALRRAVPVIGLSVTVIAGVVLGLWMVSMALSVPAASKTAAAGHGQEDSAAHNGHSEADPVEMSGMSSADMAAMSGMSAADMAAVAPAEPAEDAMAGMSAADMAVMTPSEPAAAHSSRPLAATLAGFALLNLSVLIAAVVLGHRRKTHSRARPQRRGGTSSRGRVQSPPVPVTAPVQSTPDSAGSSK